MKSSIIRHLAELDIASAQLVCDVHSHVTAPAFTAVERDDADRLVVLPVHMAVLTGSTNPPGLGAVVKWDESGPPTEAASKSERDKYKCSD